MNTVELFQIGLEFLTRDDKGLVEQIVSGGPGIKDMALAVFKNRHVNHWSARMYAILLGKEGMRMEKMEKGKILVKPTPCNFWFACKADQKEPVFGRYGLTKDEAITKLKESFPEFEENEVAGEC